MISPLVALQLCAEARAILFAAGEWDLAEAWQPLEQYATESGLIEQYGPEIISNIIYDAFKAHIQVN